MSGFLKKFSDKSRLFCFTPEVMLATFLTEIALAIYILIRYRLTTFDRLIMAILILLGLFQFVEYQVCATNQPLLWSRFGFVIITFLPVLGLHLISLITGKTHFLKLGYTLMLVYILIFLFAPKAITGATCGGNYIIFHTAQHLYQTYGFYYFGLLFLGIWESFKSMNKENGNLLKWLIFGYGSFLLPMGIVYLLAPETLSAIPSIMCGFALIFAFILAFKIAPLYNKHYGSSQGT